MDNRLERIGALRKYVGLLEQEEVRLLRVKRSPNGSSSDRSDAVERLRVTVQKIVDAEKELRTLSTHLR
jgi:hypothetical protein